MLWSVVLCYAYAPLLCIVAIVRSEKQRYYLLITFKAESEKTISWEMSIFGNNNSQEKELELVSEYGLHTAEPSSKLVSFHIND